jgi:hypothetical protein
LWRAHLPFNCPRLLEKLPFTLEKQTMKEPFTIERLQKETKKHDLVLKKYERPMNHTHLLSSFCLKIGYIWKATYLSKANICMFRASKMLTTFCISSRTLSLSLVFHIFPYTVKCTSPAMLVKAWQVNCALEHRVCRVSKNISWYNSYHILSIETPLIWYDTQLNKGIDKNAWHNCMIWKNYCWSSIN